MRQPFPFAAVVGAIATLSVICISPAQAQPRQITDIDITPTDNGLVVNLQTEDAEQARLLEASFDTTTILDLLITQLAEGINSRWDEPINGIDQVSIEPLDINSVRIRIVGIAGAPRVAVDRSDTNIVINITPDRSRAVNCRRCSRPDYPGAALSEGIEGTVVLHVEFDAEGNLTEVVILSSSGDASLDQAALAAVRTWELDTNGQAGSITVEIPFVIQ